MNYHVRWLIRKDMQEVLAIEAASFEFPWTEDCFIRQLRKRNSIGIVVEPIQPNGKVEGPIVGYMIYEMDKRNFDLVNIAVHPDWRRQGVGAAMLAKMKNKLCLKRRRCLNAEVRESNLDCLLWLKSHGFQCVAIERDYYENCADDMYLMRFKLPRISKVWRPENRMANYFENAE